MALPHDNAKIAKSGEKDDGITLFNGQKHAFTGAPALPTRNARGTSIRRKSLDEHFFPPQETWERKNAYLRGNKH